MSQHNDLNRPARVNRQAITTLINHALQSKRILSTVWQKDNSLLIFLESVRVPDEEKSVNLLRRTINEIDLPSIKLVTVYGRSKGKDSPSWIREFEIDTDKKPNSDHNAELGESASQKVGKSKSRPTPMLLGKLSTLFKGIAKMITIILWSIVLSTLIWLLSTSGLINLFSSFIWNLLLKLSLKLLALASGFLVLLLLGLFLCFVFRILQALPPSENTGQWKTKNARQADYFNSNSSKVWVKPHNRDGKTHVKGHWRNKSKRV